MAFSEQSLSARTLHVLTVLVLVAAVLLGGGSRHELLGPDIVALISLPLLGLAVWRLATRPMKPAWRFPLLVLCGLVLLPLVQLVPLPPALWSMPARAEIAEGLQVAGLQPGWAPISLSPQATFAALLSLTPAIAVFLAVLTLGHPARRNLIWWLLALGMLSVALGAAQIAGGQDTPLRFYEITNVKGAVGFFSNRNHLATLLLGLLVLGTGVAVEASGIWPPPRVAVVVALAMIGLCIVGVGMSTSRAGVVLLAPAVMGAVALAWRGGVGRGRSKQVMGLLVGAVFVGVMILPVAFNNVLARFETGFSDQIRLRAAGVSWDAILAFAPFGSGLGTFVPVYKIFEGNDALFNTYVNHAHNDWIEVVLESGVFGLALLAAFLVWFGRTALTAWREGGPGAALPRAGSLAVLLILLHSALDYPLRTPAVMCLFAFACGLMITPHVRSAGAALAAALDPQNALQKA